MMESARLPRLPALGALQLGLIGALLVLAAVAWVVSDGRMQEMDTGPGTDLGGVGWFVGVWVVMMAAMMFPSIAPMVVMHARLQESRRDRGKEAPAGATVLFVAGYLITWTAAGLLGYAIVEGVRSLDIGFLGWGEGGRYVAVAVLAAAAGYQLTPLKHACLSKCRNPYMFLLTAWRPGRSGALRMGAKHGAWCVGCCWALMAALFALGVMSIGWMALIAALIAAEKLLPRPAVANLVVAVVLLVLAVGVLAAPADVPGLTLPDSPEAAERMDAMGMEAEEMEPGSSGAMDDEMTPQGAMDDEMP